VPHFSSYKHLMVMHAQPNGCSLLLLFQVLFILAAAEDEATCRCWAAQGQCDQNPKFMLDSCAASCERQQAFEKCVAERGSTGSPVDGKLANAEKDLQASQLQVATLRKEHEARLAELQQAQKRVVTLEQELANANAAKDELRVQLPRLEKQIAEQADRLRAAEALPRHSPAPPRPPAKPSAVQLEDAHQAGPTTTLQGQLPDSEAACLENKTGEVGEMKAVIAALETRLHSLEAAVAQQQDSGAVHSRVENVERKLLSLATSVAGSGPASTAPMPSIGDELPQAPQAAEEAPSRITQSPPAQPTSEVDPEVVARDASQDAPQAPSASLVAQVVGAISSLAEKGSSWIAATLQAIKAGERSEASVWLRILAAQVELEAMLASNPVRTVLGMMLFAAIGICQSLRQLCGCCCSRRRQKKRQQPFLRPAPQKGMSPPRHHESPHHNGLQTGLPRGPPPPPQPYPAPEVLAPAPFQDHVQPQWGSASAVPFPPLGSELLAPATQEDRLSPMSPKPAAGSAQSTAPVPLPTPAVAPRPMPSRGRPVTPPPLPPPNPVGEDPPNGAAAPSTPLPPPVTPTTAARPVTPPSLPPPNPVGEDPPNGAAAPSTPLPPPVTPTKAAQALPTGPSKPSSSSAVAKSKPVQSHAAPASPTPATRPVPKPVVPPLAQKSPFSPGPLQQAPQPSTSPRFSAAAKASPAPSPKLVGAPLPRPPAPNPAGDTVKDDGGEPFSPA